MKRITPKPIPEYISKDEVPKWILDLDKSGCIIGKIYNIYSCRECMIEHEFDKTRKHRVVTIYVKGIGRNKIQCDCKEKLPFKTKFKICFNCGLHIYGAKLMPGKCSECNIIVVAAVPKVKKKTGPKGPMVFKSKKMYKFYRMGELVESVHDLQDENAWNCGNRNECLDVTKNTNGSNMRLGCKECPNYLPTGI